MPQRFAYIHETTTLGRGGIAGFNDAFSRLYQPLMEREGARLLGHWRANPFNSGWNEITTIWEIDGLGHFGAISGRRFGGGESADRFAEWDRTLEEHGAHGEGRLCTANDDMRSVEELKAEGFRASAVLQEIMTTKTGMQREYLVQLKKLFVPWSERMGNRWLGSFVPVSRGAEVIHYWALQNGWDGFGQGDRGPETEAMLRTWMVTAPALRESWDDSHLAALPQHPLPG